MPYERTLTEILGRHADSVKDDIRVCLPATVIKVNEADQTVDVQIAVKNPLFDQYGQTFFEDWPSIAGVRLAVLRGGGFFVWVPVAVGDSVELIFNDVSLDVWAASLSGKPVEPGWRGKHTVDSPVAIPCIAPDARKLKDPAPDKVIIGKDDSNLQIQISATEIDLGKGASDFVALASLVMAQLASIRTWANSHTHLSAAPGSPTAPAAPPLGAASSVAAALVKAK